MNVLPVANGPSPLETEEEPLFVVPAYLQARRRVALQLQQVL